MEKRGFRQLAIAVALAGLTLGVQAQSSVAISGYLDVGIYRDTSKTWQVGPIQRSNIQFSGEEDLGGGLAATFALNHRFDTSTGANESVDKPFWHGESTVGLKGGFGAVQFGRRLDAMYANDWSFDPWGYFDRIASPAWDLWHYNFPSDPKGNNGTPEYGRLNNGVFYDSPTMGGFTVHLSGSPEKAPGDANRPLTAAVQYKSGWFAGMLAHGKNSAGNTDTFVGLKGTFSNVGVMGAYDISKAGASKAKSTTLGATYTVDLWTLKAGWGQVDVDGTKAEKMVGIGASYALSKRTTLYADFGHKSYPTQSANTYGVGMAHSF